MISQLGTAELLDSFARQNLFKKVRTRSISGAKVAGVPEELEKPTRPPQLCLAARAIPGNAKIDHCIRSSGENLGRYCLPLSSNLKQLADNLSIRKYLSTVCGAVLKKNPYTFAC